jgi:hypothetical protein
VLLRIWEIHNLLRQDSFGPRELSIAKGSTRSK